jgi:RNA polymerase-binding transcription factor DksA
MARANTSPRNGQPGESSAGGPPVDLEEAEARLVRERARVESLARDLRTSVGQREGEADAQPTAFDPADNASDTAQRTEDLSILEALEKELEEIDAALGRVADGTYGIDEQTGEPIDPARLEAVPTARTNVPGRDR